MRRIKAFFAAIIALSFVSCANDIETKETETETTAEVSSEHQNKVMKDDWRNITPSGEHDVSVLFVNVGKADSIIVDIDGSFYMIDTGTSESVPYTFAALEALGVDKLSGVFITHPDRDHVGGYSYIRDKYEVECVYSSSICGDMYVIEGAAVKDTLVKLDPGEVVSAGDGVYFEVLGPIKYNADDDNNNSLVLRLRVNGVTVLFAGDMKKEEEKSLLNAGIDFKCDVLKVGHHGRKDATSEKFIESAQPEYAVISTSTEEEERSANENVIEALEKNNCEVYITEDYDLGIMMKIEEDGRIIFDNFKTAASAEKIKIDSVSKSTQILMLKNKAGYDVDLSGWYVTSSRGGEVFCFPKGTVIKVGETLTLACKGSDGDIIWNETNVWHDSKDDTASLIDNYGNLVDTKESK